MVNFTWGSVRMIAHLTGRLAATGADHAVIDVAGVGYLVGTSARTLDALGAVGELVTVHTEMLVSEDSIRLMGFASADERDWFKLLTSVQGVGAKVALAILSILAPAELQTAVARADAAMIARANGVGPKAGATDRQRAEGQGGRRGAGRWGGGGAQERRGCGRGVGADEFGFRPAEASAAVSAANDELGAGRRWMRSFGWRSGRRRSDQPPHAPSC